MVSELREKLQDLYRKHETRADVGFFVAGFIFDIVFISEVDDAFAIAQQVAYLAVIGGLLFYELLFDLSKWAPSPRMASPWHYRSLLLHFLLGSLLNLYSLFYIKSASLLNSLVFLVLMIGLVVANELPRIKQANLPLRVSLFSICLFSFFAILTPLAFGYVGWLPVTLSILLTLGTLVLVSRALAQKIQNPRLAVRAFFAPGTAVLGVFILFYAFGWIPPVPISVVHQGIYHDVRRDNGKYVLSTENPWWKIWNSGDQDFVARSGDHIVFFAQIYSPARFDDVVYVHWATRTPRGDWVESDQIPLKIAGGRKEGYRGYAVKTRYQPGAWRVQLRTTHGQEISRIYFHVSLSDAQEPRQFEVIEK